MLLFLLCSLSKHIAPTTLFDALEETSIWLGGWNHIEKQGNKVKIDHYPCICQLIDTVM